MHHSIHVDHFKEWHPQGVDLIEAGDPKWNSMPNIISTFDYVNLIGWKYDKKQQKPQERGTAEFSLKDVVDDMNEGEQKDTETGEVLPKLKYGQLVDNGDNVTEK
jgi:hypothetical protein